MSHLYKTCLVGCGRMGATIDDEVQANPSKHLWLPYSHAAAYRACERTRLVAVSDVLPDKAEAVHRRYDAERWYADHREMILHEKPDIVSIATRPASHAEISVFAAEHGVRGMYCEKALCCSMVEADRMLEVCERYGVKFNYGTQRRYMPLYRTMRELVERGELGDVRAVIGCHGGTSGAQWGHTHTADMLLYLAGDPEVEYVQGSAVVEEGDFADNRIETDPGIAAGYLRFRNGVHGYIVAKPGSDFEVHGTDGRLLADERKEQVARWERATPGRFGQLEEVPFPEVNHVSGTLEGIREIVAALDRDGDTAGNIRIACRSQEMVLGIIESERFRGAKVRLPLENRSLYVGRRDW